MKILMREELKEVKTGKIRVKELVERKLKLNPEEVLVIDRRRNHLLTPDEVVDDDSEVEVRMVISGG